jgi:hypothetical protein
MGMKVKVGFALIEALGVNVPESTFVTVCDTAAATVWPVVWLEAPELCRPVDWVRPRRISPTAMKYAGCPWSSRARLSSICQFMSCAYASENVAKSGASCFVAHAPRARASAARAPRWKTNREGKRMGVPKRLRRSRSGRSVQ